jgi:hypothetical protein
LKGGRASRRAALVAALAAAWVHGAQAKWPDPPAWFLRAADCVHRHESPNWHLRNWPYAGGMQFLDSTWRSVGGRGSAADASPAEQLWRAFLLYERDGWGAWPNTSQLCGLR